MRVQKIRTLLAVAAVVVLALLAGCNLVPPDEITPDPLTPPVDDEYFPLITLVPTNGPPGTEVQITGAGFPPEFQVVIRGGPAEAEPVISESVTSDVAGAWETELRVPPEAEAGETWVFEAETSEPAPSTAVGTFEVTVPLAPSISLSPVGAPPGTEVSVTLSGFPPQHEVQIGAGEPGDLTPLGQVTTGAGGAASVEITIPETAEPGVTWNIVAEVIADPDVYATAEFSVIPGPPEEAAASISPTQGPPGTEVQVAASGFPPNTTVDIGVGRQHSEYDVIGTALTDGQGNVQTTTAIPTFAEVEELWVVVVVTQDMQVRAVSNPFLVTRAPVDPPTPTPPPDDLFTATTIYLVAVGDAGQIGTEFGCNDSLVPVEVAIEPTVAPLRASLEALLAANGEDYGRPELSNVFSNSNLEIGPIDIQNETAIIYLSGDLNIAGVCDMPRVEMQLTRTALQFSTVNEVEIYIDGVPLEEVLDLRG